MDIIQKYNEYTFFWSGPFSNWFNSQFTLDGQKYNCVEQYMMQKKALMFGDTEIANAIMNTFNPKEQKALGRQVRGFKMEQWAAVARDIVYRGCVAKFQQNATQPAIGRSLMDELLNTKGTLLVEASPLDQVWGIGLDAKTAKVTPIDQWKGTNWLGQCLTEARETFEVVESRKTHV